MSSIGDLSLRELLAALRDGAVTSEAVVGHYLARIEAVNPQLNALVRFAPDAMEHARAADLTRARGETLAPLHGVPFTVKDWIEVAGLVCDAGYEQRRNFVPKRDATVIARLKAAGGIVLGKSKTGGAADALHPRCCNPIDPTRTPGASSSGEAALVRARATPFGIGSDSGGSIRWPAHCCGIAGLKPSHGRVPNSGHVPPIIAMSDPRTVIGPLTRRADDLAVVHALITGPDGIDPACVPVPNDLQDANARGPWRIAWFAGWDGEQRGWGRGARTTRYAVSTDDTGQRALQRAVDALRDAGHTLVEAAPPRIEEARSITDAYWARPESISMREWQPPSASVLNADEVEASLFAWDRFRRAMLTFMQSFDLLLCPAAPRIAPLADSSTIEDYSYTLPFSLSGQPVVSLPAAQSPAGLQANVQLVAPMFYEARAIEAARQMEARLS